MADDLSGKGPYVKIDGQRQMQECLNMYLMELMMLTTM